MVGAAEQADAQLLRSFDRAVGALGRLTEGVCEVRREQERHTELLAELVEEIDWLLEPASALAG